MDRTEENLKIVAVFHWVVAALAALMAILPLLYVGMGTAMLRGMFPPGRASTTSRLPPPMEPLGWFMIGFGLIFCLGFLTWAILLAVAANNYSRHRRWTFCLVIAAISCGWFPIGTMLGVFSILTLARPETKALFGEGRPVALPSGPSSERAPFG